MSSQQSYCQSCGMPMNSPGAEYGTEADGSASVDYCSHCYQGGKFQFAENVEQMVEICLPFYLEACPTATQESGRAMFEQFLPTLKRWRAPVDLEAKATELLAQCPLITFASVSSDGYPRPCVLAKLAAADGFKKIYVATGKSSRKTAQFRANPKAGVSFFEGHNGVSAIGTVRILDDPQEAATYWQDWMFAHFPGGADDPDFCVLEFSTVEAVFYVDGIFETKNYRA